MKSFSLQYNLDVSRRSLQKPVIDMHIIPRLILSQIHAVKGHMEYVCAISFDVKYRIINVIKLFKYQSFS